MALRPPPPRCCLPPPPRPLQLSGLAAEARQLRAQLGPTLAAAGEYARATVQDLGGACAALAQRCAQRVAGLVRAPASSSLPLPPFTTAPFLTSSAPHLLSPPSPPPPVPPNPGAHGGPAGGAGARGAGWAREGHAAGEAGCGPSTGAPARPVLFALLKRQLACAWSCAGGRSAARVRCLQELEWGACGGAGAACVCLPRAPLPALGARMCCQPQACPALAWRLGSHVRARVSLPCACHWAAGEGRARALGGRVRQAGRGAGEQRGAQVRVGGAVWEGRPSHVP